MDEEMEWAFKEWERNLMEKFVAEWSSRRMRKRNKKGDCNQHLFWSSRNFVVYFHPSQYNFSSQMGV
jgi:hypothetical protein